VPQAASKCPVQDVMTLPMVAKVPRSRLLIVDDDPGMRENLAELFESLGYAVQTASDTAAALVTLDAGEFDVLLTDYKMPGPSGMDLIEAACRRRPGLRAILMTAFGDHLTEAESARRGALGYLNKPFEADEVVAFVERILALRGA
jgi:DNA-binding NtrC family response regulator